MLEGQHSRVLASDGIDTEFRMPSRPRRPAVVRDSAVTCQGAAALGVAACAGLGLIQMAVT